MSNSDCNSNLKEEAAAATMVDNNDLNFDYSEILK